MAKDERPKRRRSRKSRTIASSTDATEVENSSAYVLEDDAQENDKEIASRADTGIGNPSSLSFSSYYLRKVTMELQDDLDKLRSASDFNESSLPILISALQQGEALYADDEKQRILGSIKAD